MAEYFQTPHVSMKTVALPENFKTFRWFYGGGSRCQSQNQASSWCLIGPHRKNHLAWIPSPKRDESLSKLQFQWEYDHDFFYEINLGIWLRVNRGFHWIVLFYTLCCHKTEYTVASKGTATKTHRREPTSSKEENEWYTKTRIIQCTQRVYIYMAMNQYLLIPFLVEWTSIYQLFWCSPGVQGFDTLPYI